MARLRQKVRSVAFAVASLLVVPYVLVSEPPLPPGTPASGLPRAIDPARARVLIDSTAWSPARGERAIRQEIFDEAKKMIEGADGFIVADFFLWNDWQGVEPETHRALAQELAEALAAARARHPDMPVLVLTDPINMIYGSRLPAHLRGLAESGARVIVTDLFRLRDSNRIVGPPARFWGFLGQWNWLNAMLDNPRFANPFTAEGGPIDFRQLSRLLQFKANHRKTLIVGGPGGTVKALVGSLNPADGSSAHSNVGIAVEGGAAIDALESELQVMDWSIAGVYAPDGAARDATRADLAVVHALACDLPRATATGGPRAQWLTEGAIRDTLLHLLAEAGPGDEVRAAIFYISDRGVIDAFRDAAARGVKIRMILDPNRDAFGRKKNGIPNRPVAADLPGSIGVRWANTHGEQFHPKALSLRSPGRRCAMLAGSANWTRRNLQNLNLEADMLLMDCEEATGAFEAWFDRAWGNTDGLAHTTATPGPPDGAVSGWFKGVLGAVQEWSGAGTF